jgi:hypothetical protein
VIHTVRRMARAIQRRPAWQVMAVYVPAAWATWALVAWLTEMTSLPSWTPMMALTLLVIMAPVVLATAVAQRGLPWLRIEDAMDPNELLGLTPEQVLVIPDEHPLHGSLLFTWRNAILAAMSCAALLVTSVVAYMTMWALGIGPVGSLIAQGVIEERDPVVLARFEDHTDDPSLAALVTDVFALELERSSVVTLKDSVSIRDAMLELGADPSSPLTTALARTVAQQEGTRLVLSGDVVRSGSGYLLTATILYPSGSLVARFEQSCDGDVELLSAIERLSQRVRERLGEPLRSIREGDRVAPIASTSEDALVLFHRADRAATNGEVRAAIDLLEEAVVADPDFAIAWMRLGLLSERAADPDRARTAYQTVIDLWASGGAADITVARMRERLAAQS